MEGRAKARTSSTFAAAVVFCTVAIVVAVVVWAATARMVSAADAKPTCAGSLQALIDAAPSGAVVETPGGCVYRETVTIGKPITLKTGPGAEIRGSDVWSGWTKSGRRWMSSGTVPAFEPITEITDPEHPYPCRDGTSRCKWPEQAVLDGQPLKQVASDPRSGQFAVDADRRVILGDDPTGHRVEVTVRDRWVVGRAANVTIEGFVMKHAANGLGAGALSNNARSDWTVKNNDLSWAHGTVLNLGGATGLRMEGNDIHHGGLMGVSSTNADIEALNNVLHHNNTEEFFPGWKSAGIKVAKALRFVASGNEVYNNDYNGIWADVGSENVTISNNRVHHNVKLGIHIEISDHAEVFGNVLWENGWDKKAPSYKDAGIAVVASRDVEVYENTLAWNNDGVTVVNSQRESGVGGTDPKYDTVSDVLVHDNTILANDYRGDPEHYALAWIKTNPEGNLYDPLANNRGYDNRYWYSAPEGYETRYFWEADLTSLDTFNETPGEERGRYLLDLEKDVVIATNNIPASPENPPPPPDTTAPTTSATSSPDPNPAGWHKADVTVTLSATDDAGGSGVKEISYSINGAEPTIVPGNTAEVSVIAEGETAISYYATDRANNTGAEKTLTVRLDKTAPGIDCGTADDRWRAANVSLDCTASDSLSGLADAGDSSFSLSTSVPNDTEDADASTGSRTVSDVAGNSRRAGPISGNRIDRKAPEVSCGTAGNLWHKNDVSIGCTADDGGSGLSNPTDADFSLSTGVPDGTETANARMESRQVGDGVGNLATAGPIGGIKVDKKAPEIVITEPQNGAEYELGSSVAANYSCSDAGSGVASCDGPVANGDPIGTSSVGSKSFTVDATDAGGHAASLSHTYAVQDNRAPETFISSGPEGPTNDNTPTFGFGGSDNGTPDTDLLFSYKVDDGGWSAYSADRSAALGGDEGLPEGAHTFYVRARDEAGNVDGSPAGRSFRVDTVVEPPAITAPASDGYNNTGGFTVSGTAEPGSAVELSEGSISKGTDKAGVDGRWSVALSGVADGEHSYTARATDVAGNTSGPSEARTVTVDTSAPDTAIDSGPSGTVNSGVASFEFSSPETGLDYECSRDGDPFEACSSPKEYTSLPDGGHVFRVRATDAAGNVEPTPASRTWTVDATAPSVQPPRQNLGTNATLGTSAIPIQFSWSATDDGSGVASYGLEQSTDGGAYKNVALKNPTATSVIRQLSPGRTYRFRVRATDGAGNVSEWSYGPQLTVDANQEASGAVSYAGGWTNEALTSAYGGSTSYATAKGASARLTFVGGNVAWVAARGPDRGRAEVWIDGTKVKAIDLYASTGQPRRMFFATNGLDASVSHTLEVRVLGTKSVASSGTRVDVDAFVVLR